MGDDGDEHLLIQVGDKQWEFDGASARMALVSILMALLTLAFVLGMAFARWSDATVGRV